MQYQTTLPSPAITLTLPGQKPKPAMVTGQGGPADESGDSGEWGLFGGNYSWEVPATMTSGTIKVTLPAELSARAGYYGDHFGAVHNVPVQGSVPPVDVALAPLYTPPAVTGTNPPAWAPKPAITPAPPTTAKTSARVKQEADKPITPASGTSSTPLLLIVVVAVLLIAAAGLYTLKRLRLVPALAAIGRSPAQKQAADIEAWVPKPGAGAVRAGTAPGARATPTAAEEPLPGTAPPPSASPLVPARPKPPALVPAPVLIAVPEGPAPVPEGAVEIQLIGRVGLAGDVPEGASELSEPVLEALAALALNPGRPMTREELRALLGTGRETERAPSTVSNYLASLRRILGPERVPDATTGGGYSVVGIGTDIARFHGLVRLATAEPDSAAHHLADALSLVRGVPFSGSSEHSYGWADLHDLGDITTMLVNAVHQAAVNLAGLAIGAGDAWLATWAIEKGLLLWEEDEDLDELYLSAAAISPDRSALARAWAAVKRPYESRHEEVPKRLVQHYQSLRKRDDGPS